MSGLIEESMAFVNQGNGMGPFSDQGQGLEPQQGAKVDDLESTLRGFILKNQEKDMDKRRVNGPPVCNNAPPQAFFGPPGPPLSSNWNSNSPENRYHHPVPFPGGPHPPHPRQLHRFPTEPPPQRFVGDITDIHDFPPLGAAAPPPLPRDASSPQHVTPPTGPGRLEGSPRAHYAVHRSHGSAPHYPGNSLHAGPPQHQRARSFNNSPRDDRNGQDAGYNDRRNYHGGGRYNSNNHRAPRFQSGVKPPHRTFDIDYDKITSVALEEVSKVDITAEEAARKEKTMELLERVCNSVQPGSKLIPFGSHVSGLATAGADLDLIMEHDTVDPKLSSPESDVPVKLATAFLKRGFKVALLTKTRVPILKLTSPSAAVKEPMAQFELTEQDEAEHIPVETFEDEEWPENMSCDIGFTSHLGIMNSKMLRSYTLCDERFRQMVIFIKLWSKKRQINSPYLGTLSSYGYVLLVLHFLIQVVQPRVLPNLQLFSPPEDAKKSEFISPEGFDIYFFDNSEKLRFLSSEKQLTTNEMSLGQLLYEFFEYYAWHWDYSHDVVSIRSRSGVLSKEEKNWVAAVQRVGDIQNAYRDRYLFAIEDPFEITHNVARTCNQQGVQNIRNEFKRALHFLKMCRVETNGDADKAAGADSWDTDLLCEVATPERVRNLSKEKRDKDEFVELLKMIKQGLKVGEREKVTLPKPPRRVESEGGRPWHHNQQNSYHNGRYQQQEYSQMQRNGRFQQQQHYEYQHQQQNDRHRQGYF